MGIWNHINELFLLCYIKIHWSYLACSVVLLSLYDFVTLYIDPVKNAGLLTYANLWNTDMFLYTIMKNLIINIITDIITIDLISKLFQQWEAVKSMLWNFQHFNLCSEAWILLLASSTVTFFLEVTESLPSFSRKCLPNNLNLVVVLSSKHGVPWKHSWFHRQLKQLSKCFS